MLSTCAEEGQQVCWGKDVENGAPEQKEKRKKTDNIHGYSGNEGGRHDRGGCQRQGEMEAVDQLW